MTASLAGRLRRLWLDVHLWIGVGLLVLLAPLAVSGSILVWHDALDRALHPARYEVSGAETRLPVSAYAEAARNAFSGKATLSQVRLPEKAGDPVVAVGRIKGAAGPGGRPRNLNAWIDPPTGKVLAVEDVSQSFTMWMHRFHGTLNIPEVGRKVVGWLGWAMFISCATGLWLWWPRNNAFLKALRWRRGPSKLFNLHHMIGFWVCVPLAVLSLTGVYISFPQTSRALFGVAEPQARADSAGRPRGERAGRGPGGPGGRFAPPMETPRLAPDVVAASAIAAAPDARLASLSVPTKGGPDPVWRVQLRRPGMKEPIAIQVSDATGEARLDRGGPGGRQQDPVSKLMRQLHDGADTGPIWQTIIFLGGVAPAVLGITGVVMWLRRRARRIAMTKRMAAT